MVNLLPTNIYDFYLKTRSSILKRLEDFAQVPESKHFYELCYCICTPQSKARSAFEVQRILEETDFLHKPFNASSILRDPAHYIRFHNTKAERLLEAREKFPELAKVLKSNIGNEEKREWIVNNIKGIGLKEASHFMRNIGYRDLAILDRHILRHLNDYKVLDEIPHLGSKKQYLEVEALFKKFAKKVKIPIDELDLLFWSYETGEILK